MELIALKNDRLEVKVSLLGGALYSIIDLKTNDQLMWEGADGVWSARDYILFPFCCRRVDNYYTHEGVRYDIENHGFARKSLFTVEKKTDTELTLKITDNEVTKKAYPFSFEFRITYTLSGAKLSVRYDIFNPSNEKIYFAFGGHLGLRLEGTDCEDGTEDTKGNFIELDRVMTERYGLKDNFISPIVKCEVKRFELDKDFFRKYDTLMLKNDDTTSLVFTRADGKELKFTTKAPVIAFWSEFYRGKFACVEPWWGLPDAFPLDREISKKPLISKLEPKESLSDGYEIELI